MGLSHRDIVTAGFCQKKVSSFSFICLLFFSPVFHYAPRCLIYYTFSVCSPPFHLIIMIMTRCYCKWCDMGFWMCSLAADLFLPKKSAIKANELAVHTKVVRGLARRLPLSLTFIYFPFQHFQPHFIYLLYLLLLHCRSSNQ